MKVQRIRTAEAELIAETGPAVIVRCEVDWRLVDGRTREIVVQVRGDLSTATIAAQLRELARELER
jgi:hypothetical protein